MEEPARKPAPLEAWQGRLPSPPLARLELELGVTTMALEALVILQQQDTVAPQA